MCCWHHQSNLQLVTGFQLQTQGLIDKGRGHIVCHVKSQNKTQYVCCLRKGWPFPGEKAAVQFTIFTAKRFQFYNDSLWKLQFGVNTTNRRWWCHHVLNPGCCGHWHSHFIKPTFWDCPGTQSSVSTTWKKMLLRRLQKNQKRKAFGVKGILDSLY